MGCSLHINRFVASVLSQPNIQDELEYSPFKTKNRYGMGAVFRQIPSKVLSADDLDLPQSVRDLCDLSKGLVVVTGPTGSGKSTTLAALIDLINQTQSNHIITIEDPIEFVHTEKKCLINQRQIKDHTDSFAKALRAALRQDPDIVMVGEMRDLETIEIALDTAETGHLVFGTLHTSTAASTMDRIIDVFPAERQNQIRSMLSNSLKAVIAQTLCKKTGGGTGGRTRNSEGGSRGECADKGWKDPPDSLCNANRSIQGNEVVEHGPVGAGDFRKG